LLHEEIRAQTCLEAVLSSQTPMDTVGNRYCWASQAELALCRNDPALALDIVDKLIATAPGMASGCVIAYLWKLRGEALAAMGHTEDATSSLQAAIENAQATKERFLLWHIHASLGRVYRASRDQSEARQEFATTHQLVHELADTVPTGSLRDNFLQRAHQRLGSSP
jgi:tetratricopeptide (TPR) repeat protein